MKNPPEKWTSELEAKFSKVLDVIFTAVLRDGEYFYLVLNGRISDELTAQCDLNGDMQVDRKEERAEALFDLIMWLVPTHKYYPADHKDFSTGKLMEREFSIKGKSAHQRIEALSDLKLMLRVSNISEKDIQECLSIVH